MCICGVQVNADYDSTPTCSVTGIIHTSASNENHKGKDKPPEPPRRSVSSIHNNTQTRRSHGRGKRTTRFRKRHRRCAHQRLQRAIQRTHVQETSLQMQGDHRQHVHRIARSSHASRDMGYDKMASSAVVCVDMCLRYFRILWPNRMEDRKGKAIKRVSIPLCFGPMQLGLSSGPP